MQIVETAHVLAKIQAYSNRNVDEQVIKAWHEILEPYLFQDCLDAVADHYRRSKEWLMPSDIVSRVQEYREARINSFRHGLHLSPADEQSAHELGGEGWAAACKRLYNLAANGELTPAAYEAYQDGQFTLETMTRKELNQ